MERTEVRQEKTKKPTVPNTISDETGQYDARFMLWRVFCAEHGVPVETLPGDLDKEIREKWEQFKQSRLKGQ
jgi:hypothetical protein